MLLGVTPAIVSNLERLHNLGVRLVLDDFGTGYSSFQHLKDFPIDTIKIDRSFVANLGRSSQDAAIVASVVSMASALGLGVVAEGVENETQAKLLRELGCPLAQGYYFGAPARASQLDAGRRQLALQLLRRRLHRPRRRRRAPRSAPPGARPPRPRSTRPGAAGRRRW